MDRAARTTAGGAGRMLTTGVAAMDDDHWALLTALAQLRAAVETGAEPAETTRLTSRLLDESTAHFALEERLMLQAHYPMASSDISQHARFLAVLSGWPAPDGTAPTPADVDRLEHWFTRHVELADQPLADWLLGGTAGS